MITVRPAAPDEDGILANHYLALWQSYGTPADDLEPNARERTLAFLREGRARQDLEAFLAGRDNRIVGSVCCEERRSPYPLVLRRSASRVGYVGSMFVEETARGQGIGRMLLERAVQHLREIGCTRVLLHSSIAGRPLYERYGFGPTGEMGLALGR